jgi:hypothetical protein
MEIKKARLLKVKDGYGLDLTIDGQDKAGAAMNGNDKYKGLVHADLKNAFDALRPHLAMVAGWVPTTSVEDIAAPNMALFEKYHVHGYSLGGDDEKPGVVISGHVINYRGKAVNYHTPFEMLDGAPEARYVYMDDLIAKINVVETEIEKYFSGKRGEPHKPKPEEVDERQGDLFKSQDAKQQSTKVQILEPEEEEDHGGRKFIPEITADAEAQARVSDMDKPAKSPSKNKPPNPKRKAQTPDNRDGKP